MKNRVNKPPPPFDLSAYLPYALNRVGVRMVRVFTPELARFGISLGMWRVLAALWPDPALRLVDLALRTSIEVSTLSRTVSALRRRGLVSRSRPGQDGREVRIALTRKGRALAAQIIPTALAYEGRMAAGIPARERADLLRLLDRLFANLADLEASGLAPPARIEAAAGD